MDGSRPDSAIDFNINHPIYEPLHEDEIRILYLDSGSKEEELSGRLRVVDLHHAPDFCALSYAWGDQVSTKGHLKLHDGRKLENGHKPDDWKELPLMASLRDALHTMRRPDEPLVIWVDAICINQCDEPGTNIEKSKQVAIMADIYSKASEVRIWLGYLTQPAPLVGTIVKLLHEHAKKYRECLAVLDVATKEELSEYYTDYQHGYTGNIRNPIMKTSEPDKMLAHFYAFRSSSLLHYMPRRLNWNLRTDKSRRDAYPVLDGFPISLDQGLSTLESLWSSAWYGRYWVIQEVVKAKQAIFYADQCCFPYQDLVDAAEMHYKLAEWTTLSEAEAWDLEDLAIHAHVQLGDTIDRLARHSNSCPVSELLDVMEIPSLRGSMKKSHDRVYAVRALSRIIGKSDLLYPDYELDISELWRLFTISILKTRDFLETSPALVLAWPATQWKERSPSLPSWVPDLEALTAESLTKASFYINFSVENCAGGQSQWQDITTAPDNDEVLIVRAALCFKVDRILPRSQRRSYTYGHFALSPEDFEEEIKVQTVPHYLHCYKFAKQYAIAYDCIEDEFGQLLAHGQDLRRRAGSLLTAECAKAMIEPYIKRAVRVNNDLAGVKVDIDRMTKDLMPFLEPDLPYHFIDSTRLLATTTDGWIGWVPADAQPDDYIYVLEGAPFPFVLRYHEDGHYKLIGDAWVQATQDADVWPIDEKHVRTIRIC
ncbi:hypothetical protein LTR86_004160 [Recurvomyces mirabilis]|nr:hypothetical protein LTR86_004160 [Recurvomyces mirabilis]